MNDDLTLEEKIDEIHQLVPIIKALGKLLVRRQTAIERAGIGKNTVGRRVHYEELGKRKTYIEVKEIAAVKMRGNRS